MNKLVEVSFVSTLLVFAFSPAQAVPLYVSSDFSGSVTNTPHLSTDLGLQRTKDKDCNGCPEGIVSGHVIFDSSLTPDASSGIVNIPLDSIMDVSSNSIFLISLGSAPLLFDFGGTNIGGDPAIQFENGVFSGFSFSETFLLNGNAFRFDIDGNAWSIRVANKNGVYSELAASGILNTGSSGLFNQQVLESPSLPPAEPPVGNELPIRVPEPTTLPLLGLGLAAMAFLNKKGRIKRLTTPTAV